MLENFDATYSQTGIGKQGVFELQLGRFTKVSSLHNSNETLDQNTVSPLPNPELDPRLRVLGSRYFMALRDYNLTPEQVDTLQSAKADAVKLIENGFFREKYSLLISTSSDAEICFYRWIEDGHFQISFEGFGKFRVSFGIDNFKPTLISNSGFDGSLPISVYEFALHRF